MSIISGLRYPTALAFGLLLTASIFWSLWSFTSVTFELTAIETKPIKYVRTIVDTPAETKFQDEVVPEPLLIKDIKIGLVTPDGPVVDFIPPFVPGTIDTKNIGNGRMSFDRDRDVTPLVRINPTYPPRAIARGIEGWVQVQFTITGTGTVRDVMVVESSPPNIFDNAAVEAVSRWRYNPKVEGAVAVDRVGVQTLLRFDLEEE